MFASRKTKQRKDPHALEPGDTFGNSISWDNRQRRSFHFRLLVASKARRV